jgi:hypothetical protein
MSALRVLCNAERRIKREITRDEITGGLLSSILIPEDYKVLSVSKHPDLISIKAPWFNKHL